MRPLLLLGPAHPDPPDSRVAGPQSSHSQGILKASSVPAECDAEHETRAKEMAQRIAGALGYCGVYAVEFFVMSEGSAERGDRPHLLYVLQALCPPSPLGLYAT